MNLLIYHSPFYLRMCKRVGKRRDEVIPPCDNMNNQRKTLHHNQYETREKQPFPPHFCLVCGAYCVLHALDVPLDVRHAVPAHESGSGRGRNAVLTAPLSAIRRVLPIFFRQQRLTEHVVDFMGARVVQILAFEVDLRTAEVTGHMLRKGQARRTACARSAARPFCVELDRLWRFGYFREPDKSAHQRLHVLSDRWGLPQTPLLIGLLLSQAPIRGASCQYPLHRPFQCRWTGRAHTRRIQRALWMLVGSSCPRENTGGLLVDQRDVDSRTSCRQAP